MRTRQLAVWSLWVGSCLLTTLPFPSRIRLLTKSATQIISSLHIIFPAIFSISLISLSLSLSLFFLILSSVFLLLLSPFVPTWTSPSRPPLTRHSLHPSQRPDWPPFKIKHP